MTIANKSIKNAVKMVIRVINIPSQAMQEAAAISQSEYLATAKYFDQYHDNAVEYVIYIYERVVAKHAFRADCWQD